MINNHLIMDCMEMQQLKARYDEAKGKGCSSGMEAAREAYRKLSEKIEGRGKSYTNVYRLYVDAAEHGNEYIDLHDVVWDKDGKLLFPALEKMGLSISLFFHMVERGTKPLGFLPRTAVLWKDWLKSTARAGLSVVTNMKKFPPIYLPYINPQKEARKRAFFVREACLLVVPE